MYAWAREGGEGPGWTFGGEEQEGVVLEGVGEGHKWKSGRGGGVGDGVEGWGGGGGVPRWEVWMGHT